MVKTIIIQFEEAGQRIDNFLFKHLKAVPKVRIYRAIRKGEVRSNRSRIKPDYRLKVGDQIRIPPLEGIVAVRKLQPPKITVSNALLQRIVYEDKGIIVMNKPAGLPVHGGTGIRGGLIELLRIIRPDIEFLELIHRLDKETSGCLLLAKKRQALLTWHHCLTHRQVHKQYIALVKGEWIGGARKVDKPLIKNILSSGERIVKIGSEGKSAVTLFRPLAVFPQMSLVEAWPTTGRTHQIRVHAAHLGFPIAADDKYGDSEFNRHVHQLGLKRLFLHAAAVSCDEANGFGICIPLEAELQTFLKKFTGKNYLVEISKG